MSTQRKRLPVTEKKSSVVKKMPAREFPVQREIQKLEDKLNAFNERIAELEGERHRGHAMEVLKVNAMDFARQIDELRSLLIESTKKGASSEADNYLGSSSTSIQPSNGSRRGSA